MAKRNTILILALTLAACRSSFGDGMVCGMSTWVGNPLSNVCIWP